MFRLRAGRDTVHSSCSSPGACPATIVSTPTIRLAIASILDIFMIVHAATMVCKTELSPTPLVLATVQIVVNYITQIYSHNKDAIMTAIRVSMAIVY